MTNSKTMLAAALALAISAPAMAQEAVPATPAPEAPPPSALAPADPPAASAQPHADPVERAEPERVDRPADAAVAAKIESEPRQRFWGWEPGRPYEEVDSYTLPVIPIRLSGYFWVDTGYMAQDNTHAGDKSPKVNYAQGRFVLDASYRRDLGSLFAEARVQLVGEDNEYTNAQYDPHTQDAFVRVGGRAWDLQVGRFLAWEPYYRGNGIERYTAEENGALGGPPMYRLDYALGHENAPGQVAMHLYPADWAALEVSSVYGQEQSQNKLGVRPTIALRKWGFLAVAGAELVDWAPQDRSDKVTQRAKGVAGRLQYTLARTTLGVDAARARVDAKTIDGLVDADKSFDKTTVGAFLEADFWNNVVGAGYHLTTLDNEKGEHKKHHQAFVSYLYRLPIPGLWLKGVLGFARAQLEDVDARATWENDMTSFRVRVGYDFR